MAIEYYGSGDEPSPVVDVLESLDDHEFLVVDNQIDRLHMVTCGGPMLPRPHSAPLTEELHALQCHAGQARVTIIYGCWDTAFVLLHAVRGTKVGKAALAVGERRWADYKSG